MSASSKREVRAIVRAINVAWTKGRPKDVGRYFHPDVVFVAPGFRGTVRGRAACVKSFVEFCRVATVRRFRTMAASVDAIVATAVASYRFEIDYEIGGKRCSESGHDLWVFERRRGKWRAVWRTMIAEPTRAKR
ncbi:MAG: nuclear transport factor 2 family protein [Planctomycetes bacterium]|nr:nuclear transport factor 2 family protein [Planctomycetota bacterium]